MKKLVDSFIVLVSMLMITSCGKFLEESSQDLVIPKTIDDLGSMFYGDAYPGATTLDITYIDFFTDDWQCMDISKSVTVSTGYIDAINNLIFPYSWNPDMFIELNGKNGINTWTTLYKKISACNILLDYSDKVSGSTHRKNYYKAQAKALRAYYYFHLVNIYGWSYNAEGKTPETSLGVPLMLKMGGSDELPVRNSVKDVYNQILEDLHDSERLFIEGEYEMEKNHTINVYMTYALLSRVYLYMENYDKVIEYADKIIESPNYQLLSLGSLTGNTAGTFNFNSMGVNHPRSSEVIWSFGTQDKNRNISNPFNSDPVVMTKMSPVRVASSLADLYDTRDLLYTQTSGSTTTLKQFDLKANDMGDLRYQSFFKYDVVYVVSGATLVEKHPTYADKSRASSGVDYGMSIRLGEVVLNRAEAYIRKYLKDGNAGHLTTALAAMNELRICRYDLRNVEYKNIETERPEILTNKDALTKEIMSERRRELCFEENHRWYDLKRCGMPEIVHEYYNIAGLKEVFTLPAKGNGYLIQIPQAAIDLNKNLEQNPRHTSN